MKLFLLLCICIAATCHADDVKVDETLARSVFQNVIDTARDIMKNGLPILGIQPIDPLARETYVVDIEGPLLNLKVDGYEAVVSGASDFVVQEFKTSKSNLTMDFEIVIPLISIRSPYYDIAGNIYNALPFYGRGGVFVQIHNTKLLGRAYIRRAANLISMAIQKIENARVEIGSVDSKITGLLGGGDMDHVVNALISDLVPDYVARFSNVFIEQALPPVIVTLNRILFVFPTWVLTYYFDA